MMEKLLSVIVPAYNFGKYLEECIDSIYHQKITYGFEVIVRDDCSTDNTKDILVKLKEKYPDLIILNGDVNLGALENIKTLLNSCRTKYIAYIDGDDYFDNYTILNEGVEFLENSPNYSMVCAGTRYLYPDGTKIPTVPELFISSFLEDITTDDLLTVNHASFARVFRNIPNLIKDYFKNLPYVDWPLNYEISKHGLTKFIHKCAGIYRISNDGMFSNVSEEEKNKKNLIVINELKKQHLKNDFKTITIVDCFIHNENVLGKLELCINNLKKYNHTILLVSNTIVPERIIKNVDYHLYNSNNILFEGEYTNSEPVLFWKKLGGLTAYDVLNTIQKHGLPVMVNLFNSLDLCKSLGFTHFQRIEVDDLYTGEGYEYMRSVPLICSEKNKKGMFYFNEGKDISFHYFYCGIEYFQQIINRVSCEEDYKNYLLTHGYGTNFINVEKYLYDNINRNDPGLLIRKDGGGEMNSDFYGTLWNTETTSSNVLSKFRGCSSKLYNILGQETIMLLSYNYNNFRSERKIIVKYVDNTYGVFYHGLDNYGHWSHNIFENKIEKILVYDSQTDEFLYEIINENIVDYIVFS
jgi:glycosyltransferase involved in cell wall biosynthesis